MTMRTAEEIIAHGPSLDEGNDMTHQEALVIAYNCIEDDIIHGRPRRRQALATIRKLLIEIQAK